MLSISTASKNQNQSVEEYLDLIQEIGFNTLEFSIHITKELLNKFIPEIRKRRLTVSSLHNFCPAIENPPANRTIYNPLELSSIDEEERKQAIFYVKRTIDSANELGAKAVILHVGTVPTTIKAKELVKLYKANKRGSEEFLSIKNKLIKERSENVGKVWSDIIRALEEIHKHVSRKKVKIGIETRYYYEEIPSFEEFFVLFKHFDRDKTFGYWHDIGHAEVQERLGFAKHEAFLEKFKLIGVHFHDIVGVDDHKAPGVGEFDFQKLKPYLKNEIISVVEANSLATKEELKKAYRLVTSL